MPEGLEAEIWRRAAAPLAGRTIVSAQADERVSPPGLAIDLTGATVTGMRRVGKVLLFDLDCGGMPRVLGLHFGMTGRLVVDGASPIERLEYASGRDEAAWDRLVLWTTTPVASPPALRMNDPRRLGHISLDADLAHLGPDLFEVTARELERRLANRRIAVKTALLDQGVVAGLGNLLVDEMLWRSGITPHRPANTVTADELRTLVRVMRRRLPVMLRRGGSTTGELSPEIRAGCPPCSRDGEPLRREAINGRTTVWCPGHQR